MLNRLNNRIKENSTAEKPLRKNVKSKNEKLKA